MTESMTCPQGWQSADLLAHIEGYLDPAVERELLRHIETCPVCMKELHAIKRMDALLGDHPESFHPEEEALFRFAVEGNDPDASISPHLDSCTECGKNVEVYRQMRSLKETVPDMVLLPQDLENARLRQITSANPEIPKSRPQSVRELFSRPFRIPALALGTAAAAVLLAVLIIPLWQQLHENTLQAPAPLQESPPAPGIKESPPEPQALPAAPKPAANQFSDETRAVPESTGPAVPSREGSPEPSVGSRLNREGKAVRQATPAQPAKPYGELHAQAPPQKLPATAEERKERFDQSDVRRLTKRKERELTDMMSRSPELLEKTNSIVVRIVITDSEGKPISLSQLQRSQESPEREKQTAVEADAVSTSGIPRYRIHIRLLKQAQEFDIDAKLFDESPDERNPLKSVMEYHVSKEELPKRIHTVVDSLVQYCKDLQKK
jgi:anti-sigma factor RsiW